MIEVIRVSDLYLIPDETRKHEDGSECQPRAKSFCGEGSWMVHISSLSAVVGHVTEIEAKLELQEKVS